MKVTFDTQARQTLSDINRAAERVLEYQNQVSSGKRVQRPSDDPLAAAAAIVERGKLAITDRYLNASESTQSRLLVADTALSDVIDQISAARSAVIAAQGSTTTPASREAKALELEGLRDALLQAVNTSFAGSYVFGGATATARPYTKDALGTVSAYSGSTLEVSVAIDDGREATTVFNGESLIKGAAADDVFVVLDRAIDAARAGDSSALAQADDDLEIAFDRATAMQSRVGAGLRSIEDGSLRLAEAARSSEARLVQLEDANIAAAITSMTQADTVYRAALGAASQMQRLSLMDYLR